MKDAKKYIARNMGLSTSSIPGSVLPPDETEDTCPLCGRFMLLDKRGYCNTDECNTAAREVARKIYRDGGNVDVPGLYYRFGDLEVVNFTKLEQWEPPKQVKHPDMCQQGECTDWARPADYLCKHHRLAENREEMLARNAARRKGSDKKRQPRRSKSKRMHGNKIKGLDKLKLK
jgi:hypothetical protein